MLRKHFVKLASVILVLVCMFSFATPAFAASGVKDDPYGYTWFDESNRNDVWYFQYYSNNGGRVYSVVDYAYLIGNTLYDADGDIISKKVRAMDDDPSLDTKPTVAFYNGYLYFITTSGEVCRMNTSTATKYSKYTSTTTAKYFTLDADGLGSKVGSSKLSNMSFSGSYSRDTSSSSGNTGSGNNNTNKTGNYVLTYATPGDPLRVCYDAYRNNKLIVSIACKNANVWVETEKLLLSETCVGAKFVGYSQDYYTILYDQDGTVYAFAYGDYDRAIPISLGEEIMSYKKDDKGFVESITTSRKTYDLEDLLDEYGDDFVWMDSNIEYVVNSTSKSTAYDEDKDVVATLYKSGNYLYYDNSKLSNSYKATYLGFTKTGCAVWINNDSDLYYYDPVEDTVVGVRGSVTRVRYDSDGFAYQYTIGSNTYSINF